MEEAEKWLSEQESKRFDQDKVKRPSTKRVFEAFFSVDVKVVLDRQPLVGIGPCHSGCANSPTASFWCLCITFMYKNIQFYFLEYEQVQSTIPV